MLFLDVTKYPLDFLIGIEISSARNERVSIGNMMYDNNDIGQKFSWMRNEATE